MLFAYVEYDFKDFSGHQNRSSDDDKFSFLLMFQYDTGKYFTYAACANGKVLFNIEKCNCELTCVIKCSFGGANMGSLA